MIKWWRVNKKATLQLFISSRLPLLFSLSVSFMASMTQLVVDYARNCDQPEWMIIWLESGLLFSTACLPDCHSAKKKKKKSKEVCLSAEKKISTYFRLWPWCKATSSSLLLFVLCLLVIACWDPFTLFSFLFASLLLAPHFFLSSFLSFFLTFSLPPPLCPSLPYLTLSCLFFPIILCCYIFTKQKPPY